MQWQGEKPGLWASSAMYYLPHLFIVKAVIRKIKNQRRQIVLKLLSFISDLLLLLLKTSFFPAEMMISQPASDTIRREFIRSKEILNAISNHRTLLSGAILDDNGLNL